MCGFCKDIGQKWYDQDFIGIIPRFDAEVDLDELLEEAAIDASELDAVKKKCAKLGIIKGNAIFWYADVELKIPKPHKKEYNGLQYIGAFKGD